LDNAKKLQQSIKRKTVLRETLHNTTGYKVKECEVEYIGKGWYSFNLDGNEFECKWSSSPILKDRNKAMFWFRNNSILEQAGYCYEYGIDVGRVKYASSLYFGFGHSIINCLWVLGEVLEKKPSYDYR